MDQNDDPARAEAIALIMDDKVDDTVALAEKLLQNPWFRTLSNFVDAIRKHHEDARFTSPGSFPRAEAEQEIQVQLNRIRKNKTLL